MNTTIEQILQDAKIAYKESIQLENELLETKLLAIIGNAQAILNSEQFTQNNALSEKEMLEEQEIQKVHRKVPRWLNNKTQYNYKILTTFMNLSNNNSMPISVSILERYSNIEDNKFLSHFNQMKTISKRNHAKVFEEIYGEVKLWEPVSEFIVQLYKNN